MDVSFITFQLLSRVASGLTSRSFLQFAEEFVPLAWGAAEDIPTPVTLQALKKPGRSGSTTAAVQ